MNNFFEDEDTDDGLQNLYEEFWKVVRELLGEGYSAIEIAGVMTAQALTIYKTVLSEHEFDSMVDAISDSRVNIKKLEDEGPTLQ